LRDGHFADRPEPTHDRSTLMIHEYCKKEYHGLKHQTMMYGSAWADTFHELVASGSLTDEATIRSKRARVRVVARMASSRN
jgi:hypothetical protein